MRTAKSCGPDAPTLASSRQVVTCRRQWQTSPVTGEITKETVKTIARGMPGCSGEPVVTTSCAFYFLHARLRVHRAPGIPCALSLGPNESCTTPGAFAPRDRGGVCDIAPSLPATNAMRLRTGAKATKQSTVSSVRDGLLRGACHRARIRATRWLAMMGWTAPNGISVPDW